mgnify:CR=1 FL=1
MQSILDIHKKIPDNTDILLTHSPPHGILDLSTRFFPHNNAGCQSLFKEVSYRIKPKYHLFGHIHE